jgi:alkanesulfonate monooxygenase SsuD/methylene tetrahydromethanopterin reductase-like flavin-dependent oxidoreductase (luciferase family)
MSSPSGGSADMYARNFETADQVAVTAQLVLQIFRDYFTQFVLTVERITPEDHQGGRAALRPQELTTLIVGDPEAIRPRLVAWARRATSCHLQPPEHAFPVRSV